MRRLQSSIVVMAACAELCGAQTITPPARFQGTGRACHGDLTIRQKTISWQTPFSHCNATPYHVIDQFDKAGTMRLTYRLHATTASCRYQVLSITHANDKSLEIGWEVTGYQSVANYQADKASDYSTNTQDQLSCYLTRSK